MSVVVGAGAGGEGRGAGCCRVRRAGRWVLVVPGAKSAVLGAGAGRRAVCWVLVPGEERGTKGWVLRAGPGAECRSVRYHPRSPTTPDVPAPDKQRSLGGRLHPTRGPSTDTRHEHPRRSQT